MHGLRLVGELTGYSVANRVVWVLPLVLLLAFATALVAVGQAAASVTLYSFF